jgi:2-polyprenyl-6-methoxyphenol hydroxylase-like FAD-dependent oxidoreductase
MNDKTRKALIIGCGIGGPALALFLKRAGIAAEIYEARATPEGYSLSLSCNGVAVLKMLSLDEPAFAEGSAVSNWSMWNGKGKLLGGGRFTYWFANCVQAEEPAREIVEAGTNEKRRQRLLELFRDDQPFIREIIRAAETIFPDFPTYTLPTQPAVWHKGPIALLGDAVHAISPSSGQGASMALEDALVLAKCLRDIPTREQAFETYEQLRRERTTKMFDLGRRGDSGKFVTGAFRQWFRDLTTPVFLKLFANPKASDWIYSYRVDWETPVTAYTPATVARK